MCAKGLARGRSHAIRPWPDREANEGKDRAANETLAIYFWQIRGTDVIETQESSSSRDGDIITSRLPPKVRLEWPTSPALRLALRYICMKILCVKSTRCPRDGTPVFGSSCAVPPQKSVGLFSVRAGCSVAWKFCMDTNSLEWNERPRIASFHSNRSNPAEKS